MNSRTLTLTLLLLAEMLLARPAGAMPSMTLAGYSGLIKTPTAHTLQEGSLALGFSWVGGPRSYYLRPKTNRMYFCSLGLLPGLEATLDMLQVIGWVDPEAPGVAYAFHRLSHLKYRLPLPAGWPEIALGAQDPVSVNFLSRGPEGKTEYGLTAFYGVMSEGFGPFTMHVGYASSEDFLRGPFGGLEWRLMNGLSLRAEYEGLRPNVGIFWQPLEWVGLQAARLFPDDWAWGTSLKFPL